MGKGEGIGEGGLVGLADGVLSELVGLMVGTLVGDLVGAPVTGAPVGAEVVGVTSGQKPHESGQAAPTSKPAVGGVSSPRLQYIPVRFTSISGLELFNNHAQSTDAPESRVKVKVEVELSAQVASQEAQVTWQAHLTLP